MLRTILLPLFAAAFLSSPVSVHAQAFPDGPGKDILERECSTCHAPDMVRTFGRSAEEWHDVVITMVDQGAKLSDEQVPVLVDYLTKNWPLKSASAPAPAATATAGTSVAPAQAASAAAPAASSGDMPADYKAVLDALGKTGDFKDGVLKVNIPRSDLNVT